MPNEIMIELKTVRCFPNPFIAQLYYRAFRKRNFSILDSIRGAWIMATVCIEYGNKRISLTPDILRESE